MWANLITFSSVKIYVHNSLAGVVQIHFLNIIMVIFKLGIIIVCGLVKLRQDVEQAKRGGGGRGGVFILKIVFLSKKR